MLSITGKNLDILQYANRKKDKKEVVIQYHTIKT